MIPAVFSWILPSSCRLTVLNNFAWYPADKASACSKPMTPAAFALPDSLYVDWQVWDLA